MILEGIVTSLDASGQVNIAPMGPIVDESMSTLLLRPFQTSRTYANLKQQPSGVFHVTDDVLLLAKSAIGRLDELPALTDATTVIGKVIAGACRAYEFEIEELDDSEERTRIVARVVHCQTLREFFGFNRAKHAVLEAAILATRVGILDPDDILRQMKALESPVAKTAGEQERSAFQLIQDYVQEKLPTSEVQGVREKQDAP
jgi:uncharacterized protein